MNNKIDDGVIKFKYKLKITSSIQDNEYIDLEKWRAILFRMNLIGEYPTEKVGFGNISKRLNPDSHFLISGTQTGRFAHLTGRHYTKVVKCNMQKNYVDALGPIAPSSESLTHFAIYSTSSQVNFIFHVHHKNLWEYMIKNDYPATGENLSYGTLEMANAMKTLITKNSGIFVMKGHQDGVIAYGDTAEETGKIILDVLKKSKS